MSLSDDGLARELLDALDAFDSKTLPLGLYACDEYLAQDRPYPRLYQEWNLCLAPRLEALGCRVDTLAVNMRDRRFRPVELDGHFGFTLPDGMRAELRLARTSKIKVRKFGSAYRIEPHNKYHERWRELRLDRELSDLWKPSALAERGVGLRLCLFIGFAREDPPFGKELRQLEEQLRWGEQGAHYETHCWADREDRHFFVRLSAWSGSNP